MLLFNASTSALVLLSAPDFQAIRTLLRENKPFDLGVVDDPSLKAILEELLRGRFFISEPTDELAYLRQRVEIYRQIMSPVLTIAPTMDCNLRCYYCFEDKYKSYMDRDVCDLVVQYVAQQTQRTKFLRYHVQWFGGEPMLNADCIEYLTRKLVTLCEERGMRYSASMVSNGACWPESTEEIIEFAQRNRIIGVQFTFDGLPDNHNRRRRPAESGLGVSSFDALARTVSALVGRVPMHLRINCDPANLQDALALVDLFVERGWLYPGSGVFPYVAPISPINETCDFLGGHRVNESAFNELREAFRHRVRRFVDPAEYAAFILPESKKVLCTAVSNNSIMVGPDGYVYKCGVDMGDHRKSHGHIRDIVDRSGGVSPFRILYAQSSCAESPNDYTAFDVFSQPTCSECKYLPLCMGGCPKQQLEKYRPNQNRDNIEAFRRFWDANLEGLVRSYASLVLREDGNPVESPESFYEFLQSPLGPAVRPLRT